MDRHPGVDQPVGPYRRPVVRLLPTITALFAAIVLVRPILAAPPTPAEDFWTFPEGSAAFFAFDPRPLGEGIQKDPNRALVEAGLRGLLDNIATVDGGGLPLPGGMLAPGVLGADPFRLCLFDLAGSPREGPTTPDRPLRIERLAAILEIRAPVARHDELIGVLRGILDRDSAARRATPGTESPLPLPGGRRGTSFTRSGEPPWREVSWCATPTGLLVGLGHGSLDRWLTAAPVRPNALPEWYAHRAIVAKSRGLSNPVLEAMIDVNSLRRALPEEFAYGRMGRLAVAWHIPNAREVMLHIRLPKPPPTKPGETPPAPTAAPLLLVDLSYSSRAEKLPACKSIAITQTAWPTDVPPAAPSVPYALLLAPDWQHWIDFALDTWSACSPKAGLEASAARARWVRAHGPALERAMARAGPRVILSGPGGSALIAPLKPAEARDRLDNDLREVFASLSSNIRFEAAQRVWTLRLPPEEADPDKLLAQFAWSVAKDGSAIRAAWDPAVLAEPKKPPK